MGEAWFNYTDSTTGLQEIEYISPKGDQGRFDPVLAQALKDTAQALADALDGQAQARTACRVTGSTSFSGYYADVFAANGAVQAADWQNLSLGLRDICSQVQYLSDAVDAENRRRKAANDQLKEVKKQNDQVQGLQWVLGYKHTVDPVKIEEKGPTKVVPPVPVKPVETPHGLGSSSSGTSSAIPDNLFSFKDQTKARDADLSKPFENLKEAYKNFRGLAQAWGTVEAQGVIDAFQQYLANNEGEARWAEVVAGAFVAAGGRGRVSVLSNAALTAVLQASGVSVSRVVIDVAMPGIQGAAPSSGFADDPVNTASGNFVEPQTDFVGVGGASSLVFSRCYNSITGVVGGFGPGWSSSAEQRLLITDARVSWVHEDGRHTVFPLAQTGESGEQVRAEAESYWLSRSSDMWVVVDNAGGWWRFDAAGVLSFVSRGEGSGVEYEYEGQCLTRLVHERGRSLSVEWDSLGERIVGLNACDGTRVEYSYDENNRLARVVSAVGVTSFSYTVEGLLESVRDADGVQTVRNWYNEVGQVVSQESAFGRTSYYSYLPGGVTQVADKDGSRSNTWVSDARGRLVEVSDSEGKTQRISYDRWGNQRRVVDRLGHATVRTFDARGHVTRELSPTGGDTQYSWDAFDRLTSVSMGEATTVYEYEGESRYPVRVSDPVGGVTQLAWEQGLLMKLTDPMGVELSFTYDAYGQVSAITNALGLSTRFDRDTAGRVVKTTTPLGYETGFTYDQAGRLVSQTAPDGGVTTFEYSAAGRLVATTNPLGHTTQIEYGTHGQAQSVTDALGRTTTQTLDDLGNLASLTTPAGNTWTYSFDALSRLKHTTSPEGGLWSRSYDAEGNPVVVTDPDGVRESVTHQWEDNSVTVEDGLVSSTVRFDAFGRPVQQSEQDGSESQLVYDRCGRVVEVLDAEAGLTVYHRDKAGRVVEQVSPTGEVSRYEYESRGLLKSLTLPDGRVETREYDADARLIRHELADGSVATAEYDSCNRVVSLVQPGQTPASYSYDLAGQVISARDGFGARRFTYDKAGQVTAITNSLGGITRYTYDTDGRVIKVTDPLGHVTSREWNALNKLIRHTDPLGRVTSAGYDLAGRQTWQETADGVKTEWAYDQSGRQSQYKVAGQLIATLSRDMTTRSLQFEDMSGMNPEHVVKTWDRLGRLTASTRGEMITEWGYDAVGRRTRVTSSEGHQVTYTYNASGKLSSVDHSPLGSTHFEYDTKGRLHQLNAPDLLQTWEYDSQSQVNRFEVTDTTGSHLTLIERDTSNRVTRISRDGVVTDYSYDEAGQLSGMVTNGEHTTWEYDLAGHLIKETSPQATTTYAYDAAGQLLTQNSAQGTTRYTYDQQGRRVSETGPGKSRVYEWDPRGYLSHLTTTTEDSSQTTSLHVGADGLLASVNGQKLSWDDTSPMPSLMSINSQPVLSLGVLTATPHGWTSPGWRTSRTDTLNPWNTTPGISLSGVSQELSLTPTGGLSINGLEWMGARAYDPRTRSFLSTDPLQGTAGTTWANNPYEYAANNPLAYTDPNGLKPLTDQELQDHIRDGSKDYILGGLAVILGTALGAFATFVTFTGVGIPLAIGLGALSGALVSGGMNTISQKNAKGSVNWGEVGVNAAIGGVVGGIGGGFSGALTNMGAATTTASGLVIGGMSKGGVAFAKGFTTFNMSLMEGGLGIVSDSVFGKKPTPETGPNIVVKGLKNAGSNAVKNTLVDKAAKKSTKFGMSFGFDIAKRLVR